MISPNLHPAGWKQKIAHELKEFLVIALFLALLFGAFGQYRILLLHQYGIQYFQYGTAIINALLIAKIIMIGEYAGLGRQHEQRPLIDPTLYKAFTFGLLAVAFHFVEEAIKGLLDHKSLAEAFAGLRSASGIYELLGQALVLFCAFIPFFAIREVGRVLGPGQLYALFFRKRGLSDPDPSGAISLREGTAGRSC